jgi:hypothetical protein
MTRKNTARTVGMLGRPWRRYLTAACGAALIFGVASGFALGFGAVVERLTTSDATARASVGAREVRLIQSAPHVVDDPNHAPGALRNRTPAYVFDGWYAEPLEATPGFRAPEHALRNESAPNELRRK